MDFILQSLIYLTSYFGGVVNGNAQNQEPNEEKSNCGLPYGLKRKIKQYPQQAVAKKQRTIRMPSTDSPNFKLPDRFIADRAGLNEEFCFFALGNIYDTNENRNFEQTKLLNLFNYLKTKKKRLIDCRYFPTIKMNQDNHPEEFINRKKSPKRDHRTLQISPRKVFGVEDLVPDYFLSPLHWSKRNILAVAELYTVHLLCGKDYSSEAFQPVDPISNYVSAVQWSDDASLLAVGTAYEFVQIWDPETKQRIRDIKSSVHRTSTISWLPIMSLHLPETVLSLLSMMFE
jgi:hypothetical protein